MVRAFGSLGIIRGSLWHASISIGEMSTPCSLQILIIVSSKPLSLVGLGIPASSILFLQIYCSDMAWAFSSLTTFFLSVCRQFYVLISQYSAVHVYKVVEIPFQLNFWFSRINHEYLWLQHISNPRTVCNFQTAKLLFRRNNRIRRKGLVCKLSSVASNQLM